MSRRHIRVARGATAAALATLLAAVAHTLAGGGAPSPLFCAAIVALATPVAVAVAGRRPALWRTASAVVVSQALFHVAFATIGDIGAWTAVSGPHVHHDTADTAGLTLAVAPHGEMSFAHAVAAVVTIAALHRGERMLRRLATALVRFVVARSIPLPRPAVAVPRSTPALAAAHPRGFVLSDLSRRGPPRRSRVSFAA